MAPTGAGLPLQHLNGYRPYPRNDVLATDEAVFAILADANIIDFENVGELGAGELATLVSIEGLRDSVLAASPRGFGTELCNESNRGTPRKPRGG